MPTHHYHCVVTMPTDHTVELNYHKTNRDFRLLQALCSKTLVFNFNHNAQDSATRSHHLVCHNTQVNTTLILSQCNNSACVCRFRNYKVTKHDHNAQNLQCSIVTMYEKSMYVCDFSE